MAQITSITSEALQATIRRLLPSQQGFGEDLQAINVVTPIIDLTPTAEGSILPTSLQQAWDFSTGHNTVAGSAVNLIASPGFWRVFVNLNAFNRATPAYNAVISLTDGLSSKVIWEMNGASGSDLAGAPISVDFIVYLRTGDTLTGLTNLSAFTMDVSYRSVADVTGNLTNPSGFVSQ